MKEQGLYYSDKEESYRKVYSLIKPPEISFDRPNGLESEEWFDEVSRRLKVRRETEDSYDYARLEFKAPVFYGNAFVDMYVNDINYRLMGSHRLRGNSIYNNAHPAIRGHREVQGLDLTFAGHIHKKGHIEQPVREFNDSRLISGLISGTYQLSSGYTKDTGFGNQRGSELGMYWVMFGHDGKYIQIMDTQQFIKRADKYI